MVELKIKYYKRLRFSIKDPDGKRGRREPDIRLEFPRRSSLVKTLERR